MFTHKLESARGR